MLSFSDLLAFAKSGQVFGLFLQTLWFIKKCSLLILQFCELLLGFLLLGFVNRCFWNLWATKEIRCFGPQFHAEVNRRTGMYPSFNQENGKKTCNYIDDQSYRKYLAGIQSALNRLFLLLISLQFFTANKGFRLLQDSTQPTTNILPADPVLKQSPPQTGTIIIRLFQWNPCTGKMQRNMHISEHTSLFGPQQANITNLEPLIRSHFLLQSLLLACFSPDFQLHPFILLTFECIGFPLEQILKERQLGAEDLQEFLHSNITDL